MRRTILRNIGKAGWSGLFLWTALAVAGVDLAGAEPLLLTVQQAVPALDPQTNEPLVRFTFRPESKQRFADFTTANVGKTIELRIDGRVIMRPVIRQPIYGGTGSIAGGFSFPEATDIARRLTAGTSQIEVE